MVVKKQNTKNKQDIGNKCLNLSELSVDTIKASVDGVVILLTSSKHMVKTF